MNRYRLRLWLYARGIFSAKKNGGFSCTNGDGELYYIGDHVDDAAVVKTIKKMLPQFDEKEFNLWMK